MTEQHNDIRINTNELRKLAAGWPEHKSYLLAVASELGAARTDRNIARKRIADLEAAVIWMTAVIIDLPKGMCTQNDLIAWSEDAKKSASILASAPAKPTRAEFFNSAKDASEKSKVWNGEPDAGEVERVARAINPGAWAVMDRALQETKKKYAGESVGWPSDQFQHKESMAIARAAISAFTPRIDEEKRPEPDMFWDYDNPEQPYGSVEELLNEMEYPNEGVVEVQQAIGLPNAAYYFKVKDDEETDDRELEIHRLTDDKYRDLLAAKFVGYAFRAMFDARVTKEAERLLDAEGRESLGLRDDILFKYIPYHVKARFEREARAALLAISNKSEAA